jgi:hypothetical protein
MGTRKALTVLGMVVFSWLLVIGAVYVTMKICRAVLSVL